MTAVATPPGVANAGPWAGKSLLIFDDNLRRLEDHPYEYARAVADMHVRAGGSVTIICHRDIEQSEVFRKIGAEVLPIIERAIWSGDYKRTGLVGELEAIARQNLYFAGLLRRHLRGRRYDLVLVPNALLHDAFTWCLLRFSSARRSIGQLALVLRYGVGIYHGAPNIPLKSRLWRLAFACQRGAVRAGATTYFTDSPQLAETYRPLAGFLPRVLPSPRVMAPPPARRAERGGRGVVFGSLGNARYDKGTDVFHEAVRLLLERGQAAGMTFVIQWNRDIALPGGKLFPRDVALLHSDRLRFLEQPLSSEEYDAEFAAIDCFVLPYRRERYAASISGICVEAASAAKPVICTSDTWLSAFIAEQGAGLSTPDEDPEALAAAMLRMANDFDRFETLAVERAPVAQARNSADAFLRALWDGHGDAEARQ